MTDPHHTTAHTTLYHGNNLDILPTLPDNSIDAVITDPPYELGFMGKKWDATGIAYNVNLWREILRVLKPGGHLCAFGGTRTYHRMACAIEDAGFEIRDSLHWIYGSGFPKSLDVSKAIDKAAGAEREVIGRADPHDPRTAMARKMYGTELQDGPGEGTPITTPATDAAREWDGWGTALKPAHEPIVLARKPLTGTVAANVLQHGTGALNINACRIEYQSENDKAQALAGDAFKRKDTSDKGWSRPWMEDADKIAQINADAKARAQNGRWSANVIVDDSITDDWARYFYRAKPSRTERNAGLHALPKVQGGSYEGRADGSLGKQTDPAQNFHPTVKPLALMQWLIRLVTPPDGTILDPFAGSGTTLAAATLTGHHAIGIELTDDYLPIIVARCNWAETQTTQRTPTLFDTHD
jgi:site-specific DNA-methyltransferase (adenine-specific)